MKQKLNEKSATSCGSTAMTGYMRWWILFWYNDITRLCIISGVPSLIICVVLSYTLGSGVYLKSVSLISYVGLFAWAVVDNNYSNLRKVGLDEYRKPLGKRKQDKINQLFGL